MSDKITPEQLHELIEAMHGRRDRERNEDKYLEKFSDGLKSADPMVRARAESDKNAAMAADNYKDALKSGKEALRGFNSALLDTSTGFTKYEHGLKNLGDATSSVLMNFGPLGKVAAAAVAGLTALTGAILKQTQNMVGAYDEMAKVGGAMGLTADSIKEYGAQAQFTTHNLKVFAKAAAESSDSLVALGGSVSGGMKKFSEFTAVGDDTLKQYRRMGMTQEDVLAAQQQYIKYQSTAGATLAKSPKELQKASLEYIDSLNKLADITGNSVKKQQEALDFAAQQENWNAYKFKREIERDEASKRGDTETAAKIDRELKAKEEFIAGTADLSQKDRGALLESIARSGAAVITENNAHLVNAGIQIDKITGNLAKGESQVIEYRAQNAEAQKNLSKQYGDGLTAYGSASRDLQKVVGADNEARRAAAKDQRLLTTEGRAAAEKELKEDIAAKKAGRKGQGAVDTAATVESGERKYRTAEDAIVGALNPFTGSTGGATLAVIALGVAATGTAALMAKSVGALGSLGGGLLDKLKGLGKGAAGAATTVAPATAKPGFLMSATEKIAAKAASEAPASVASAATKGAAGAAEGAAASSAKALASSAAKGLGRIAGPLAGIIAVADGLDTAATGIKQANKDLAEGKISQKDATVQKSGAVGKGVGQAGGGVAGALAGAAIGTAIFPVVGTAIGAALGGWLGAKGGEKIGESVGEIVGDSISTDVKDIKKDLKGKDEDIKVSVINSINAPANVAIVKGLENLKQLSQPTSTLTTKVSDTVLPKNINDLETTIDTLNKSNEDLSSIYKTGTSDWRTAAAELDKLNKSNENLSSIYKTGTSDWRKAGAELDKLNKSNENLSSIYGNASKDLQKSVIPSTASAAPSTATAAPASRDGATQRQNLAASMPGEGSKGVIPTTAPTVSAKPAAAPPASAAAPAAKPAAPAAAPPASAAAPAAKPAAPAAAPPAPAVAAPPAPAVAAPPAPAVAAPSAGGGRGGQGGMSPPSQAKSASEAKEIGAATPSAPISGGGGGGAAPSSTPGKIPVATAAGKSKSGKVDMTGNAAKLANELDKYGITNPVAKKAIVQTAAKESGLDPSAKESGAAAYLKTLAGKGLDYIWKVFPQLKPGGRVAKEKGFADTGVPAEALNAAWSKGDEAFFDYVYGGLGTNSNPGDAYKYRGRGFVGITGRKVYENVGKEVGKDFVKDPDQVAEDFSGASAALAGYLFSTRGGKSTALKDLNSMKDSDSALKYVLNTVAGLGHKSSEFDKEGSHLQEQFRKASQFDDLGSKAISAKNGGITDGPMTGYPATLHGNEIITPLTPNSILEQLAKTVAEPSGAASAGTDDASAILKEMRDMQSNFYAMMESKFSDMVDNLEESVDVQQNILQQSMT